jgi:transposase
MFLKKASRTYKGKVYETYAITESYRENGKVKHRNIHHLGPLTQEQAMRIRLVLSVQQTEDMFVGKRSDVVAKQHVRFLDVAVLDHVWRQFDLHHFFADLPFAEVMCINRCLQPKSKFQIQSWSQKTILPRILHTDFEQENEYAIYRTLDKIADVEAALQTHIFQKLQQMGLASEKAVFYDITSSYFEGSKCIIATYGYSRDHRPDRLQVTLALVITPQGYPIYWRVMPGNTTDITTVEDLLQDLRQRFGIEECLLVFDRGMVSEDNLTAIETQSLTYISAIDRNEIPKLHLLPSHFQDLVSSEQWKEQLVANGFSVYDPNIVYREWTKENKRRYIVSFDHNMYKEQQQSHQDNVQRARQFLDQLDGELQQAKKSRSQDKTSRKIENQLRKWKLHKVFSWKLEPIQITLSAKEAKKPKVTPSKERTVGTFKVGYEINEEILNQQGLLDGITCFVTNQSNTQLTSAGAIDYYRQKNKVEEAFREIKEYLQLRPFFLRREKRIRAHVSICVVGYLLFNALEQQLRQHEDARSVTRILEELGECLLNRIGFKGDSQFAESITEVTDAQQNLLKKLDCEYLISQKYVKDILKHSTM